MTQRKISVALERLDDIDKEAKATKRNRTNMLDYMVDFYFIHKDKHNETNSQLEYRGNSHEHY